MKKNRLFLQILALALIAALLCPFAAFAEEEKKEDPTETPASAIPADPDHYELIDPEALQKLVDDYAAAHNLNREKLSVGYCYLDTGDTWYYNPDTWYYGASMYKVPLMMILAEWEYEGKVTRDTGLKGLTLGKAEEYIIIYNSNDYAHSMMSVIGSDRKVREEYRRFANLPDEYYIGDFYEYSYFTARFTTEVIKTLYNESERFPNILDVMKRADNGSYFHGGLKGEYEVAQKYGSFTDRRGVPFNHCTGVVYTEHPFVLTVMTQDMGVKQDHLRNLAVIFKDYTLSLDEAYPAWEKAKAEPSPAPTAAPAETPAETAETPAETAQTGETETAETPAETAQTGETETAETPAQTGETVTIVPAESPEPTPVKTEPAEVNPAAAGGRITALLICVAVLVILLLGLLVRALLRRKEKAEREEYLW